MMFNDILKVLYAPHRAFNDIVKNPRYLGPLLILIIFVAAQVGSAYVIASKSLVEQTTPAGDQADLWTENAALWQANPGVAVTNNHLDFINATGYFNNTSIEFTADNASSVQMRLNDLGGSVNCGPDGFKNLSLRIKIVSPNTKPENVTVFLFSLSESNFFYYDLTSAFSNTTIVEQHLWNNITIPVGSEDWSRSNSEAKWENITGLRMDFTWPSSSSNIDLLVDGLFFRGIFIGFLDAFGSSVFISSALNAVTPFLFQWLLLTGLMYLLIKGLKGKAGWKPLMIAVGFALITFVIQAVVLAVVFTQLWPIERYPLEVLANVPGEFDVAAQVILNGRVQANQAGSIVQVITYVWTIALGAFITRAVTSGTAIVATNTEPAPSDIGVATPQQFGWLKSLLVSAASFLLSLLILGFVLGV